MKITYIKIVFFCLFFIFSEVSAEIDYSGTAFTVENKPLNGQFDVVIRLMGSKDKELYKESFTQIAFKQGKFNLVIGKNHRSKLASVSQNNDEFNLEIKVNKQLFSPLIKIKPVKSIQAGKKYFASSSNVEDYYYSNLLAI